MFFRIRIVFGLALLLTLITSVTVFAKGGFSFIIIIGPNLKDSVRVTEPALTTDFFAFADFFRDKTEAPDDPGPGYEITRYYINNSREVAFDHLHYYPDAGFVYYDGIVNGSSEYDGEWYTARPGIKTAFEGALSVTPTTKTRSAKSMDQIQSSSSVAPPQSVIPITVIAGLAAILVVTFWLAGIPLISRYFKKHKQRGAV